MLLTQSTATAMTAAIGTIGLSAEWRCLIKCSNLLLRICSSHLDWYSTATAAAVVVVAIGLLLRRVVLLLLLMMMMHVMNGGQ
ncbi:hypothetical protein D3C80_2053090 [compost metagenome]